MLGMEELILLLWWLIIQSLLYNTCLLICDIHLGQNLLDKCTGRGVWIFAQCAKEIRYFLEGKRGKNCAHSVHNDSSSMSLMSLTPHRKLIGHSQKTCVLWIRKLQSIVWEGNSFIFALRWCRLLYWQLDRPWNKVKFCWIMAVNLSKSLIKLIPQSKK